MHVLGTGMDGSTSGFPPVLGKSAADPVDVLQFPVNRAASTSYWNRWSCNLALSRRLSQLAWGRLLCHLRFVYYLDALPLHLLRPERGDPMPTYRAWRNITGLVMGHCSTRNQRDLAWLLCEVRGQALFPHTSICLRDSPPSLLEERSSTPSLSS